MNGVVATGVLEEIRSSGARLGRRAAFYLPQPGLSAAFDP
jgi:hypothetical protein